MNIDEVVLNFTPGTLVILNVVLGLIMFGIALDTSPDEAPLIREGSAMRALAAIDRQISAGTALAA